MNSTVPTSTLEWIQAKYGIAILFAGLLAMAMDHSHAKCYLQGPVTGGLLIALLALLSKKLVRYHYTPLQFNSGIFLFGSLPIVSIYKVAGGFRSDLCFARFRYAV